MFNYHQMPHLLLSQNPSASCNWLTFTDRAFHAVLSSWLKKCFHWHIPKWANSDFSLGLRICSVKSPYVSLVLISNPNDCSFHFDVKLFWGCIIARILRIIGIWYTNGLSAFSTKSKNRPKRPVLLPPWPTQSLLLLALFPDQLANKGC